MGRTVNLQKNMLGMPPDKPTPDIGKCDGRDAVYHEQHRGGLTEVEGVENRNDSLRFLSGSMYYNTR